MRKLAHEQEETWDGTRFNLKQAEKHLRTSPTDVALPTAAAWIARALCDCDPLCEALTDEQVRELRAALHRSRNPE